MKTLFLMRHAKSSWDHPDLSDFERPLNKRGQVAAPRIGREMALRGYSPDLIISSSALRAKLTSELVAESAEFEVETVFDGRIYGAGVNSLLYVVSEISDSFVQVMLTGHNPGFESLVHALTGKSRRMPTAALAVVEIDTESWQGVLPNSGKLVDYLVPKELQDN